MLLVERTMLKSDLFNHSEQIFSLICSDSQRDRLFIRVNRMCASPNLRVLLLLFVDCGLSLKCYFVVVMSHSLNIITV